MTVRKLVGASIKDIRRVIDDRADDIARWYGNSSGRASSTPINQIVDDALAGRTPAIVSGTVYIPAPHSRRGPLLNPSRKYRDPATIPTTGSAVSQSGPIFGGAGSAFWGSMAGGVLGYHAGDNDFGSFALGAVGGGIGGAAIARTAKGGGFSVAAGGITKRAGPYKDKIGGFLGPKAAAIESTSNRRLLFGSGAMLSGAGFSAMFAGNGNSHRQGFNRHRGNRFSR